jgi:PAS domain S-box-containing protein
MKEGNIRIFLVEDDDIDCEALKRFIRDERLPYQLQTASSAEEAKEKLQDGKFDIIILDYDLGAGTGMDLLPYTEDVPVIFITGSGSEEIAVEAIRRGASDYMVKDVDRNYLSILPLTIRTVLERKQEERSLRLYERIVDASGELMAILDRDYSLKALNEAFLKAYRLKREDVITKPVPGLLKKGLFAEFEKDKFDRCLAGFKVRFDNWFEYPGLGRRFMDVSYHPFFERSGSVSGVLVVVHDITGRKRGEEERLKLEAHMQQVQKFESLNVMAGSIAHSFNNLLMVVLGNLELALTQIPSPSAASGNIKNADKAARRVAELSKLMLTYVGQGGGDIRTLNLSEAVMEMSEILGASVPKNVHLEFEISSEATFFKGDPAQIRQIVMNLVNNASEAVGDGKGTITITTGSRYCAADDLKGPFQEQELAEGEFVFLEIADTGSGMDEEVLAKAYDPFFTTRFTGRGMGLAAVLGITRAYKGTVSMQSEPGKGTRATVLLPALEGAVKTAMKPAEETEVWQGAGTILLVDDEELVLEVGKAMLEELGFYVVTACDGIAAIEVYKKYLDELACVLLDVTMPRMGGEEAFWHLKEIKEDIPIIICSGYTEEQVSERFRDKLPAPFIGKPFKLSELAAIIRRVQEK